MNECREGRLCLPGAASLPEGEPARGNRRFPFALAKRHRLHRKRVDQIALRDRIRRPACVEDELFAGTAVRGRVRGRHGVLVGNFVDVEVAIVGDIDLVAFVQLVHLAEDFRVLGNVPRISAGVSVD